VFEIFSSTLNCPEQITDPLSVAYPEILFGVGSTNSVEDRERENGDLGAVAP